MIFPLDLGDDTAGKFKQTARICLSLAFIFFDISNVKRATR